MNYSDLSLQTLSMVIQAVEIKKSTIDQADYLRISKCLEHTYRQKIKNVINFSGYETLVKSWKSVQLSPDNSFENKTYALNVEDLMTLKDVVVETIGEDYQKIAQLDDPNDQEYVFCMVKAQWEIEEALERLSEAN